MKLSCKVIEDILPMYYDGVCSEESTALVEEHLKACPHCSHILSELRSDIATPEKNVDDMKPLKKIQKSYKKMKTHWLIAIAVILLLIPVAFLIGAKKGEQSKQEQPSVEFSKEEAIAYANEFMACLENKDYAKAYTYWNVEEEKQDLLSGRILTEEDLVTFEADGLKKFCEGGEKLESLGGITNVQFVQISDASYSNRYGIEEYLISYTFLFDGKEEGFGIGLSKYGINHIGSGDGLIRHPLSHLTLWVQWVVDDYSGRYYDFDLGTWVDVEIGN
ncbi:MAG: zf-HC2 domain-containing protein [Oscillospiraceae bacterium]|nr:zf-HC2 domain-containing protein [Oscillospiraceae bacterium]